MICMDEGLEREDRKRIWDRFYDHFSQSPDIYSLVATCKLCHIDPFAYLRDVLDRVSTHPASRIAELMPSDWKS
jgi:hypothetical protein